MAGLSATAPVRAVEVEVLPDLIVESTRDTLIPPHFAGSATVIDAEVIKNSGARSVADLLAAKGGLELSSTSGNLSDSQVRLRGFGENSNLRVLLVVDGHPVNRPDMGGVSWLEVPLSQVDHIEILRGSQTALYGDNAVAGVIHIVTKQGGGTPSGSVEIAGGSDGLRIGRASYQGTLDGNQLSLDLESNHTDGWRDNAASDVDSVGVRWKREFAPGNIARLGVSYADEYAQFPGPLSTAQYLADPRQSIYAAAGVGEQYFSGQKTLRIESGLILGKGQSWTLELPLAYLHRDQAYNFGQGSNVNNVVDTFTLTPTLKRSGETWSAEAGVSLRHDELVVDRFAQIARLDETGTASLARNVRGLFTHAAWEPVSGWHLSGALRWEQSKVRAASSDYLFPGDPSLNFDRSNGEDNTAAQVGLRWEPTKDRAAWLRYDRLYRLPATDEIAAYQGFPLTVPFNDRLHAETGHGVELGGEWKPGNWTFGANAFAQCLEGEILYDYTQNLNVNLAGTRRYGIELNGGYKTARWEAEVRYNWLTARFANGPYSGRDIYLVPHQHATAVVACHPKTQLTLQAEWQITGQAYEGNDFLNDQPKLPGWQTINLLVRYEPKPGLSVYARVNNLFDERYATVKYSGVWYPAAGRQFQAGVRQEF